MCGCVFRGLVYGLWYMYMTGDDGVYNIYRILLDVKC